MIKHEASAIKQMLEYYPKSLDRRSKQIIEMHYGLNGNPKKTLQQIGDIYDVCRERVRQIERKALRRLKHSSRLQMIEKVNIK